MPRKPTTAEQRGMHLLNFSMAKLFVETRTHGELKIKDSALLALERMIKDHLNTWIENARTEQQQKVPGERKEDHGSPNL